MGYRSPLAGLELVRVNPQTMFRESLSASGRNSAINAGWIWDFEDRMPNPWEVGGKTTNYMSMGRTTVLSVLVLSSLGQLKPEILTSIPHP